MEALRSYFIHVGFTAVETVEILSYFKKKEFEKGSFFVQEGKIGTQLGFLESGQFQYYSLSDKGEERTTYVSLPNSFVASLLTYITESPARENIRALSHCNLWVIDKSDVIRLQSEITGFKDFYIKLIEWQICCIDHSIFDLLALSAEQRYEKLMREEPQILEQVSLQNIASMLGITPRHLSRIRKNI